MLQARKLTGAVALTFAALAMTGGRGRRRRPHEGERTVGQRHRDRRQRRRPRPAPVARTGATGQLHVVATSRAST